VGGEGGGEREKERLASITVDGLLLDGPMVVCDAMRENTIDDNINAIGVSHQPAEMNG